MQPLIYLDNAATTRVDPRVAALAVHAMTDGFGNPSSAHRLGVEAARLVSLARERVARALGADPAEVTFTSGGTEANALGVLGAAGASRGRHILLSGLEHPSVAEAAAHLGKSGFEVTVVPPGPSGVVDPARLGEAARPETAVCALLWVQNELGTVQPVDAAARAVKARAPRCHVHVDAVQAFGKVSIEVSDAGWDSLSLSAHKIHGPKGAGALWLKKGARVIPLAFGGGQERALRPGTEGVPGIAALGLAAELAEGERRDAVARMARQRDALWSAIVAALPSVRRTIPEGTPVAAHILSVGFRGLLAEPLLHALESRGVYVSAGSACHARDRRPSATLRAVGVPDDVGTLRFSLSRFTTDEEIVAAAQAVAAAVKELS